MAITSILAKLCCPVTHSHSRLCRDGSATSNKRERARAGHKGDDDGDGVTDGVPKGDKCKK